MCLELNKLFTIFTKKSKIYIKLKLNEIYVKNNVKCRFMIFYTKNNQ